MKWKRDSSVVRGPMFYLCLRQGKVWFLNKISLVSFAGMILNKSAVPSNLGH